MAGTDSRERTGAGTAPRRIDDPPATTAGPGSFIGWPGRRHLFDALWLSAAVMAWFVLVYGGADLLTAHRTLRIPLHLPLELQMPFVPGMILFYMSLYLLFAAAPFILRTTAELRALALTLAVVIFAAGIGFLLLPAELAYDTPREYGMWTGLFVLADRLNLNYNLAPSLHVALGIAAIDVFSQTAPPAGKVLLWTWGAAICLSTLLTHQHHLLDVVTGLLLALAATRWLYPRLVANGDRASPVKSLVRRGTTV